MQIFSVPLEWFLWWPSRQMQFSQVFSLKWSITLQGWYYWVPKGNPFEFFPMEFHRNVELNFEMSLGARVALIFSRDLVRYSLADTHRENKSSSTRAWKHRSSQSCDHMKLHMVYADVWECCARVNCCHSRVRPLLPDSPLWFSASVTIQKSHFQTFYCALKNTSSFPSIYIYNFSFPVLPLCCQYHISTVSVYPGSNLATATCKWVKLLYQSSLHTVYFV